MTNIIITQPTAEPITLAEAKLQLRVTDNVQDTQIGLCISAAREHLELILGRSIMPQTREVVLNAFPDALDREIALAWPPVVSVASVIYMDALTNTATTLASSAYVLDNASDYNNAYLVLLPGQDWPKTQDTPNAVRVRYTAGYADAASVPAAIKMWLLLAIEHLFDRCQAGGSMTVPETFAAGIIDRYRVWGL